MNSWEERQRVFSGKKPPVVGMKLIWFKGGAARNRVEEPIQTVWFVFRNQYNWQVLGEDGRTHNVLPTRLYTIDQFEDWMTKHREAEQPKEVEMYCEATEEDKLALVGLPEHLKEQLSSKFRERYEI